MLAAESNHGSNRPLCHHDTAAGQRQIGQSACVNGAADRYPESLRDALPRGESYPLTRSEIVAALISRDAKRLDLMYFLRGGQRWSDDAGTIVDIQFRAAGDYSERLELRVFSVPRHVKSAIASGIGGNELVEIAEWIAVAGRADHPWRSMDHRLTVRWERNTLHRQEFDGLRARPY
jgi:hypothetical protein